jgi:hypothetical protein
MVSFVVGELDEPVMVNGRLFYNAITTEKAWVVLEGVGHGVIHDSEGHAAIREALLDGLEVSN